MFDFVTNISRMFLSMEVSIRLVQRNNCLWFNICHVRNIIHQKKVGVYLEVGSIQLSSNLSLILIPYVSGESMKL